MKKKNKFFRREGALRRLEEQISSGRLSVEFSATISSMAAKEKEAAVVNYWDRKHKECSNLKKKL